MWKIHGWNTSGGRCVMLTGCKTSRVRLEHKMSRFVIFGECVSTNTGWARKLSRLWGVLVCADLVKGCLQSLAQRFCQQCAALRRQILRILDLTFANLLQEKRRNFKHINKPYTRVWHVRIYGK